MTEYIPREELEKMLDLSEDDVLAMSEDDFKTLFDTIHYHAFGRGSNGYNEQRHKVSYFKKLRDDAEKEAAEAVGAIYYHVQRNYQYDTSAQGIYPNMSESDWRKTMDDQIKSIFDKGSIDYIAYIYHDRDVDGDGLPKPLHYHAFVKLKTAIDRADLKTLFGASSDRNCEPIKNKLGTAQYLTHISTSALDAEKTIYDFNDVLCHNCRYRDLVKSTFWDKQEKKDNPYMLVTTKAAAEKIADDYGNKIRNGVLRKDIAIEEFEKKVGYSWVRKLSHTFDADQERYIQSRVAHLTEKGRNNTNIYIMGSGGIGKSVLGRKLAIKLSKGGGVYASAPLGLDKTPDALNSYTDESVAIFNEMSSSGWALDEFLECFDPYSYAAFPSRNKNKDFIGHTSIFTNSISPLRFAKELLLYSKGGSQYQDPSNKRDLDYDNVDALDKYWQVRRRFDNMIVLLRDINDDEIVHAHVFILKTGTYETGTHMYVGCVSYGVKVGQAPGIHDGVVDDLLKLMHTKINDTHTKTIDEFLKENNIVDKSKDVVIDNFVDDVINNCVWDLLPRAFVYDLYRAYRMRNYPKSDLLNRDELLRAVENRVTGEWELKTGLVSSSRMDKDEPLISEYELDRWMNKEYTGTNKQKLREFSRALKYRGFVRI